jgi:acetate kinase
MRVLVVNAGSATLKLALLDGDQLLARHQVDVSGDEAETTELESVLDSWNTPDAVGHRVVHGGGTFTRPVRIDGSVRTHLDALVPLAPLHQPAALSGIDLVARLLPDVASVACFDTAFHTTLPPAAATYAIPAPWRECAGFDVRRYGFHGLSHAYASRRSAELVGRPVEELRTVICHLGAGASLCAVHAGESVDTTMGFTPLEGLVMASRSGDVDPGLLLWLLRQGEVDVDALGDGLEHHSGLAGLAGSPDMRQVLARAGSGDGAARLAVEVYVHRLRAGIAAMAASLSGVDVVAFTGGVGEHSPAIRSKAVDGLGFLGLGVDAVHNADADGDADISAAGSPVHCLVVSAREDLQIAREVAQLLG